MLADMNGHDAVVAETFAEAGEVLGRDLWSLAIQGPVDAINETEVTQPLMLAGGVAVWRCWCRAGGAAPNALAGHSLGEYAALVAAGALDFRDAVRVVAERARRMQAAVPAGQGAMAAILGLADEVVEAICREVQEDQVVAPANYNSPGQLVIAGNSAAVERAMHACQGAGARKALKLNVSVPSHCALMEPAAQRLALILEDTRFNPPSIPVHHNVDAGCQTEAEGIRQALIKQLSAPVQWTATVQALFESGSETFGEAGPGRVLCGLGKRIQRGAEWVALEQPATLLELAQRYNREQMTQ
jgi:[acyl-carrier-protein] S-malonyltransferase